MKELQAEIEDLEQKRTKWLIINLIGFIIWDSLRIIDNHLLDNHSSLVLTGIMLFGWIIWSVGLFKIMRLGKKVSNKKLMCQIFNDELIKHIRFKTMVTTLIVILLTQMCIIIASFVIEISGQLGAEISIFAFAVSIIGGFLFFNSKYDV